MVDIKDAYDVIIIGSGGAGMTAAITAHDLGLETVIFEKTEKIGGNTNKASSGMNASESSYQEEAGIEDKREDFFEETLKGGHGTNQQDLLHYFVDHSAQAIDWLADLGIVLDNLTITGGMSKPRTHRPHDGSAVGGYLVKGLKANVDKRQIPVITQADVQEILVDQGQVKGVKVEIDDQVREIKSQAVIIASGGFGANAKLVEEARPELAGYVTTSGPGITGDGILMAQAAGAGTVDMDQIQVHPTVHQDQGILIGEAVRGEGAILVDSQGQRFTNELGTRDVVSQAITDLPDHKARLIFDQGVRDRAKAIEFYAAKGYVTDGDGLTELAEKIGLPADKLVQTVADYNQGIAEEKDEFGRTTGLHALDQAPYYAIEIAPGVHYTMGGLSIDQEGHVLKADGSGSIPGLYACGEVVGGLHGSNRIGGNSIGEIIVFGRLAGQKAAEAVKN
ncbi:MULTISPECIES: flavocytochrome c [Aerococcus]|uniref:Flavocytochrome c n=1 Tax=Aerococcus mictus TaxID=2976810 RepID=A0ABZ2ECW0_9LACT|nr:MULTISPECIES: flavocytochrome c [Aerococcus]AEA00419.1 fumarate reductase flavoprotein subunit [Aerococcus sp. Group 1]KAA9290833.1 flavocytochrome c [Aerococcus mictus]MBU5610622.1 flavocytochrome c [Aerococcus urinae]MCY3031463.1 flavocytochrome c [Aerococcus sp. Group 1]MCY3039712.1 flavocytochrome c [Aerococcus sp. Group 2]